MQVGLNIVQLDINPYQDVETGRVGEQDVDKLGIISTFHF